MHLWIICLIAGCLSLVQLRGQLPASDVYLIQMDSVAEGGRITSVSFLNGDNAGSYNNQPRFAGEGEVLISAGTENDKTDLFSLFPEQKRKERVTATKLVSEFSPFYADNGKTLFCVRIEADGVDQSLWAYPADRSGYGKRMFPDLTNIGYFCPLSDDLFALFLVGEPHTLVVAHTKEGEIRQLSSDPGRCLRKSQGGELLFTEKAPGRPIWLKAWNSEDLAVRNIARMPHTGEDFTLLPSGDIVHASGDKLYLLRNGNTNWDIIADLRPFGIIQAERVDVAGNQLVVVNKR